MEVQDTFCVNHPRTQTLVRCSNCDSPICVKCMVQTPVGQKCLSCGRMEFKADGGSRRYLAGAAGLFTAAVMQAALTRIPVGVLGILIPLIVGYATGLVVKKAAGGRGWGMGSTAGISTVCGMAMGLLFVGARLPSLLSVGFLFSALIAAYVAAYRANH